MASKYIIIAGLQLVVGHTEKSCVISYYRQLFSNDLINHEINISFVRLGLRRLGACKTEINFMIFHFTIRGN